MYFVLEYLLFAAKAVTVVGLCLLPLVAVLLLLKNARRHSAQGELVVERLNDKLLDRQLDMEAHLLPDKAFKQRLKDLRKTRKAAANRAPGKRLF